MDSDKSATSLSLLERVRGQDPEAWKRLLFLYEPLVSYWCGYWGLRGADVEDVRQEVFQTVSASLGRFRRDRPGDTFRGWLRGITRLKVLEFGRRRQRQPEAEGGSSANMQMQNLPQPELPEAVDPPEEVTRLYHRALELVRSEFAERTWTAFWRVAVDGHAPADVAAETGVSAAAVRKAKSRVLHRLREELGDLTE